MTNYYDVARMANTMAVKTTIVLDPTQITTRVKNSIKKQLRQGRITGGWRSNAAKIAEMVVDKFELAVSRDTWRGVQIKHVDMQVKQRLLELVEADWAAMLMESTHYGDIPYYGDRYMQARNNLQRHSAYNFFLQFNDSAFVVQARAILSEAVTPAQLEQIEKAIDVLDGTDPIHIVTHQ